MPYRFECQLVHIHRVYRRSSVLRIADHEQRAAKDRSSSLGLLKGSSVRSWGYLSCDISRSLFCTLAISLTSQLVSSQVWIRAVARPAGRGTRRSLSTTQQVTNVDSL